MLNVAIILATLATAALMMQPRLRAMPTLRAMITPLASIIGSGFLVLGPILVSSYGVYAPFAIAGLCGAAYLFAAAIRFNVRKIDTIGAGLMPTRSGLEYLASALLGFAYMISVAYYLNLFGAFGVSLTRLDDPIWARLLTTAIYMLILSVGWGWGWGRGWGWGFKSLEAMEYTSVSIKPAIIAGLLVGLALHISGKATAGTLVVIFGQSVKA